MAKNKNNSHKATPKKVILGKPTSFWKKKWVWLVVIFTFLGGWASIITIKGCFEDDPPTTTNKHSTLNLPLIESMLNSNLFDTVKVIGVTKLSDRDSIFNEGQRNLEKGNSDLAFVDFNKVLVLDTIQNHLSDLLYVYACLGAKRVYSSPIDTSMYYYKEAIKYLQENDSLIYECYLYNYMGLTFGHHKMYDSATYYLNKAERITSDNGYIDVRANIKGNLGMLYFLNENYRDSKIAFEETLPIYRSEKDSLNMQKTLEQLSDVLIKLESYIEAQIKLKEAMQIAVFLGDEADQARLYLKLVELKKIPVKINFSK